MKKLVLTLITLIAVASLFSCQNNKPLPPPVELTPARIHTLTTDEFIEKIGDLTSTPWRLLYDKPVIIDFYADWCGPCKILEPHLWNIADEYYGKVDIFRVDVEADKKFAALWEVSSLPSLYFIPQTGAPKLYVGYRSTADLRELVEKEFMNK